MKNPLETKQKDSIGIISPEQVMSQIVWQGPMPPPQALAQYDKIVPGSGNRILTLAEDEAKHRRKLEEENFQHRRKLEEESLHHKQAFEDRQLKHKIISQYLGQVFGFIVIILGLLISICGHPVEGIILAGSALTASFLKKRGV